VSSIQPYKEALLSSSLLFHRFSEDIKNSVCHPPHILATDSPELYQPSLITPRRSIFLCFLPSFYPVRCLRYPLLASHPLFLITHQVIVSSTDHNNIVLPHYTLSTPTHSQATSNNTPTPPHSAPSFPSCVFLKGDLTNTQDAYEDNVIVCYIHGFEGQLCEYVKG